MAPGKDLTFYVHFFARSHHLLQVEGLDVLYHRVTDDRHRTFVGLLVLVANHGVRMIRILAGGVRVVIVAVAVVVAVVVTVCLLYTSPSPRDS